MKKIIYSMVLVSLLAGCAKEGDTGPAGIQGTAGTDGADATDMNSISFAVYPYEWNLGVGIAGNNCWSFEKYFEEISQDVVDNGGIEVFMKMDITWVQLPYTIVYDPVDWNYQPWYKLHFLRVEITQDDLADPIIVPATTEFKIVIISDAGRVANPGINGFYKIDQVTPVSE